MQVWFSWIMFLKLTLVLKLRWDYLVLDENIFILEFFMSRFLCSRSRYLNLKRNWERELNLGKLGLENEEEKVEHILARKSALQTWSPQW